MERRWVRARAFLAAALLAAALPLGSRADAPAVQSLTYALEGAKHEVTYALFVPSRYEKSKPAPLVVLLHGLYSSPQEVIRYAGIVEEAEQRGYIVAAPYGYNSHGWYGSLGQGKEFTQRFRFGRAQADDDPDDLGRLSEQDVLQVLERVRKAYAVDPDRVYLMGHSMGGGGTLYLAMKYGSLWAAIAPLAPAIYSDPAELARIRTLPAIVVQGDSDRLVRVDATRRWVAKMEEFGMPHTYVEIEGGDHVRSIAQNPAMIRQVFDFFDAHRRGEARAARKAS